MKPAEKRIELAETPLNSQKWIEPTTNVLNWPKNHKIGRANWIECLSL
jgi:hypothetical protein